MVEPLLPLIQEHKDPKIWHSRPLRSGPDIIMVVEVAEEEMISRVYEIC